jgi:hypothetical protein
MKGDEVFIKELLTKDNVQTVDSPLSQRSLLHLASQRGHPRIVQLLLDMGADANALDTEGSSPLIYASDPDVVEKLILHGANPIKKSRKTGLSRFEVALQNKETQVLDLFYTNLSTLNFDG